MNIYALKSGTLSQIKELPFKLEREIQLIFEQILNTVMGLGLVKSRFSIKNKRIDTLAYDPQSKAFIIIEYKKDKNISVVDQGFTYLSLMLEYHHLPPESDIQNRGTGGNGNCSKNSSSSKRGQPGREPGFGLL